MASLKVIPPISDDRPSPTLDDPALLKIPSIRVLDGDSTPSDENYDDDGGVASSHEQKQHEKEADPLPWLQQRRHKSDSHGSKDIRKSKSINLDNMDKVGQQADYRKVTIDYINVIYFSSLILPEWKSSFF
ncbi:hypothetical protein E3N88_26653 [Mikania micrantha]|uniref:Uncharacterized protein n=1 Tax=Mikania micrantha TaxID=192012 RepID=A0A5N6MXF5_9ASTR|nr:hypothetical protein E3N88_26653 [Mikania micrantha]